VKQVLSLLLPLLLGACAEAPKSLYLSPTSGAGGDPALVWPSYGEVPRFAYAGELLGESNFRVAEAGSDSRGRQLLAWIAGLDGEPEPQPLVLQRPQGGAVDAAGRIYVSDVSRQAIFVFDPAAGELLLWEWADDSHRFKAPVGVAVRADGEVLVADAELGRVVRLGPDGRPLGAIGKGDLSRPTGLALDPANGRLYVADTGDHRILVFGPGGRLERSFGRPGGGPDQLNAPTYLAVADGRVYVTDTLNARVQVFDEQGRLLSSIGQRGLYVGNLTRPKGVAVSREGLVYVVESYYDTLLVFDREGRFLMPIGGAGHAPGQFFLPAGVWLDERGQVYVADMLNGRVSIFQFLGADT
jgi:DNA-binding beta-propeller fold protein YncE